MDMDTQVLRWFQEVADGATVTEVSEMERTSQSGVSRALARLEAEVGAPLFRRSGRLLRLTHAGAAFKHHVDQVIHHVDDGVAAVQQIIAPETGMVTLSFEPFLGRRVLPRLLGSFRATYPQVRFDLRPKRDETVTAVRARGEIDLELSTLRPPGLWFEWQRLAREPLVLALSPSHRLAGRNSVALGDVADEPFITLLPTSRLRQMSEDLCRSAGFEPRVAFECDELSMVHGYVAAGLGVAVVPASALLTADLGREAPRSLSISDDGATYDIGVTWPTDRRMLPSAELFLEHIRGQNVGPTGSR